MMIEKTIVNISKDPKGSFFCAVEGNLAEVIGKTKTRFVEIRRYEGTPVCCTLITVEVSL